MVHFRWISHITQGPSENQLNYHWKCINITNSSFSYFTDWLSQNKFHRSFVWHNRQFCIWWLHHKTVHAIWLVVTNFWWRLDHFPSGVIPLKYPSETHLQLKSREISFVHNIRFICSIVFKICTKHDSIKISERLGHWIISSGQTRFCFESWV